MGKPSTLETFTDSQLYQYIKEVKARLTHHATHATLQMCRCMTDYRDFSPIHPIYQAFSMTESEHKALMEKVQSTEVRKGCLLICSNDCADRDPWVLFIDVIPRISTFVM